MESREVQAIRRYIADSGLQHRVTSTYRYGTSSYHGKMGTDGWGLAVDFAGPVPCRYGCPALRDIFDSFGPVESQLAELIYSGASYSIKDGRRVPRYSVSSHWTHVHIAGHKGTFIQWPAPAPAPIPSPIIVTDFPNGVDMLRRLDLTISTDSNGNGWAMVDVTADRVVSIIANGPYPPVDGYWNQPVVARQMRDGRTVVTVTEGLPSVNVALAVWITE